MQLEIAETGVIGIMALLAVTAVIEQPARPIGDPGRWIAQEDYPNAALAAMSVGVVMFELGIDPTGQVERCRVLESSGSGVLDGAACGLLTARGRFMPAVNAQGQAIEGTYRSRVRWQFPDGAGSPAVEPLLFQPFNVMVQYDIAETGAVENCKVIAAQAVSNRQDPCVRLQSSVGYQPVLDKAGKPVRTKVLFRSSLQPQ